jgi:Tol biopolymer transport system component
MDTTQRLTPVPRAAWLLVLIALLVVMGMIAAIVGSRPQTTLDPFGPAANGVVVYADYRGDIYVLDPEAGTSRPLISDRDHDAVPIFSRDGSMIVFARRDANGLYQLTIAQADGTIVRSIAGPMEPVWLDWSPDGTRLAVIDSSPVTFSIVSVDGSERHDIDLPGLKADQVFWRPNGEELVVSAVSTGPGAETHGLYLVRADGSEHRPIVPPTSNSEDLQAPALSPDGTQIIYTQWEGDEYPGGHLYVVDVDGGDVRKLFFDWATESDYYAKWSPDGSQIVFNRGRAQDTYYLSVAPAGGGHVVDIGSKLAWGPAAEAAFSPDGSKVIARYSNGETWMFPATGGPGRRLEISTDVSLASWQRIAP